MLRGHVATHTNWRMVEQGLEFPTIAAYPSNQW
jgi:hypothetical protein